jgi:RND superfamily putative drug exporter
MFEAVGRAMSRRPWWVVLVWVAGTVGIVLAAPRLAEVTNSDQSSFLPAGAESARAAQLAGTAFPDTTGSASGAGSGAGATAVIVVKRTDGSPLDDRDVATVGSVVQRLDRGIRFDPTRSVATNRTIAIAVVQFAGPAERADVRAAVVGLRADTADALRGTGLTAGITGEAAIVVDNRQAFGSAERIVTITTLLLIVVLLLLIFRSPLAALLPLLSVGLVFGVSSSLVAIVAKALHFTVGQELPTMLTVVLFGIGTDYILFLLFRYRERLRAGDSPGEAIVAAVDRVGKAIFSAAFAVIAAFSALVLASLGFFTTLGPSLAIGVLVMLAAALTLVPAIVSLLGERVFWPVRPARPARPARLARVGRLVARRPVMVLGVTLALLGGLAVAASQVRADYDPIGALPAGTEASRAYADLQRGFPPGALNPVHVYLRSARPLQAAEIGEFVRKVSAVPGVASPMEPRVAADGRTVDVPLVLSVPPYSGQALDLVSGPLRIAAWAAEPPEAESLVGGQTMALADIRGATNRDLRLIFPVAAVLFVLILGVLLRAVRAPVYLVGAVVLGFAATLGATALVFQGRLAFSIPIILYLFVTAIGTDYNILISARIREEMRDGRPPREAAALAIQHAGPSVAAAALILAGTFGSLLVSGVPFFTQIGFAVTLGIVLVAFVISILLVPAAVAARPARRSRRSGSAQQARSAPLLLDRRGP